MLNTVNTNLPVANNKHREANIGKLLLDLGKITLEDAERIIRLQKVEGLRFGAAAQKLGMVTEADIRQALSLQFDYPYLQPNQGSFSKNLVAAYQPFSPQVEALRALRSQLILTWFNEGNKSLAVVSANEDEGCSNLAANLAVVFSQLGEQTLLIDANLREPAQHKIFNLNEPRGLSDILVGRADLNIVTRIDSFVNLSVLGAGTVPPNPQELLSRSIFTDLINHAITHYDIVIVDTAPAGDTSDAQTVAGRCGGALLVSKLNQTRVAELENVRDQLTVTGVQIVGAVVNDY
ncbi:MAG: chain length determinant protein tyrosine kinase EpsG [Methylotenera sp.]|nr:MAG: chain length determinant protein tyrosine kinase EpsG [Methylotenera sp.]